MSLLAGAKAAVRRFTPKCVLLLYHNVRASLIALAFGYPAKRLTVIGVTGTNGKSTVVSLIGQLLEALGERVGWISTATISIRGAEELNRTKLTTASPAALQGLFRRMARAGCRYTIVEASSEGLEQGRLNGIRFRAAVFTNLTPEHIESHGSFENYARAKERLFWRLSRQPRHPGKPTFSVVNLDDPAAGRFARFPVDRVIGCSLKANPTLPETTEPITLRTAAITDESSDGSRFTIDGVERWTPFVGRFNVMNVLEAAAVVEALGFPLAEIARRLPALRPVPGRLELIDVGQPFRVLVDYAPEPASLAALYSVLPMFKANRIIHVFGSCGGMRDHARRPILGRWVAERADVAIVTNEDPYDEPPEKIIDEIMIGVQSAQPKKATVERVTDRRTAIRRALELAEPGDLVAVTGKASEQWIVGPGNQKTPWDDRRIVREEADRLWKTEFAKKVQ